VTDLKSQTAYRSDVANDPMFTLVLKTASYMVTAAERTTILTALKEARSAITIDVASHCACCDQ
jgi:hypothetical protein